MLRKEKKLGSLALSMNAIVVLILAIAMLGVGLYTVRLVKTRVVSEFEKMEAAIPDPSKVSGSNPITTSPETIVGGAGDTVGLKVNVYNIGEMALLRPKITSCEVVVPEAVQVNNKTLEQAESAIFVMLIPITKGEGAGRYLCALEVEYEDNVTKTVDLPITIT